MIIPTHGMMPGANVCETLTRVLRLRGNEWRAVVRSIDSACTTGDLTKALAFHRIAYDVINRNICLSLDALQNALSNDVFTGFDEVWIIEGPPPAFDLAPLPYATSDGADFSSKFPEKLADAMEQTNCVLILGDGCGLNYCATYQQLQEEVTRTQH
ncbi:MAG: hypothetical protein ACF8GE_03005 [Phycisphaerales bacterium JB043]